MGLRRTCMSTKVLIKSVSLSDLVICLVLLLVLWRKGQFEDYKYYGIYICCRVLEVCAGIPFLYFRRQFHIPIDFAWNAYWYSEQIFFVAEMVLQVFTIYAVYRLAMRGLEGLQRIGQIIFRWIAGVSFGLALFFALGPHTSTDYYAIITAQIHQGISVLSLCLLLFVCLAIRPLGLTFRSRIFGVALGLGIAAASTLVESAWLPTSWGHNVASPLFAITGCISLCTTILWTVYFALPEQERRMILLPTTSPFFVWNSISEALGDEPGYVAVSGFKPEMLSAAEIEELSRSTHSEEFVRPPSPSELGLTGASVT